jgi:amicoumacin kinase
MKINGRNTILVEDRVLNLAKLFSNGSSQYKNLNGFHNQIYQVTSNINFILRIASTSHSSKDSTLSELDFLLFLKEKGVSISAPIKGIDGNYVYELTENNKKWIVSAFEIAKGNDFRARLEDNDTKLKEVGRMLGKIHRYSKQYKPYNISLRRHWNESQHLIKAGSLFEKNYPDLKKKFDKFINQMNEQPKDSNSYGLIHGDYLFSNYFFEYDNITIFDFDECEYSWFIYDIAVCMYYYLLGYDPSELHTKTEEAENLFFNLLSGYIK